MKYLAWLSQFFLGMTVLCTFAQCGSDSTQTKTDSTEEQKTEARIKKLATQTPQKAVKLPLDLDKIKGLTYQWVLEGKPLKEITYDSLEFMHTPYAKASIQGVLCFRGDPSRSTPSYGVIENVPKKLEVAWEFGTSGSAGRWGGGAGWTGQPAIVRWSESVKQMMNLKPEFKAKKDFVEVIYASLDGRIYFLDLQTGKKTREPINISNPIKGSVSVDPRGYPILYCGQGIPEKGEIGFRIFSLIDQKMLYFINGRDEYAYRKWAAFDCSPLINRFTDAMYLGGENGIFYFAKLNTNFDTLAKTVAIAPKLYKYRYQSPKKSEVGSENSLAMYKNLAYFPDNSGFIQCIDMTSLRPVWTFDGTDDTDASIALKAENDTPYVYVGCEVDKQGITGNAYLRKINGFTGKLVWEAAYKCSTVHGAHPVNGGLLASPLIGKQKGDSIIVFSVARYKTMNGGLMVALHQRTGKEVWRWEMPNYAWSSPVDIYDKQGNMYIIQSESQGNMYVIDGKTGKTLTKTSLGNNTEASPAVFNDMIVVGIRGAKFFAVKIKN